jgi:hypothetical protein
MLAKYTSVYDSQQGGPMMRVVQHKNPMAVGNRKRRLTALQQRVRQQISDANCLITMLDEYCREHPDDAPCAANDPAWREQTIRQREELQAMLLAIGQRLAECH